MDTAPTYSPFDQPVSRSEWWIILPIVKPLTLNDVPTMTRGARMGRHKKVAELRANVKLLCRGIPPCERVRVTLVYEPAGLNSKGRRMNPRRDPLNLVATLKVLQDGIVDAGVVPDDTSMQMESPMPLIDTPRENSMQGRLSARIERLR